MCNRYNIKGSPAEIADHLRATLVPNDFELPSEDIIPGSLAPGLLLNGDGERELVPMPFGLALAEMNVVLAMDWPAGYLGLVSRGTAGLFELHAASVVQHPALEHVGIRRQPAIGDGGHGGHHRPPACGRAFSIYPWDRPVGTSFPKCLAHACLS